MHAHTGVIKSASSFAMFGDIDVTKKGLHIPTIDPKNIKVRMEHFDLALREVLLHLCSD